MTKRKPKFGAEATAYIDKMNSRRLVRKAVIGNVIRSPAFQWASPLNVRQQVGGNGSHFRICKPAEAEADDESRGTAYFVVFDAGRFDPRDQQGAEGRGMPFWVVEAVRLDGDGSRPQPVFPERIQFFMQGARSNSRGGPVDGNVPQVELCGEADVVVQAMYMARIPRPYIKAFMYAPRIMLFEK